MIQWRTRKQTKIAHKEFIAESITHQQTFLFDSLKLINSQGVQHPSNCFFLHLKTKNT
jgi:hypothetical protein